MMARPTAAAATVITAPQAMSTGTSAGGQSRITAALHEGEAVQCTRRSAPCPAIRTIVGTCVAARRRSAQDRNVGWSGVDRRRKERPMRGSLRVDSLAGLAAFITWALVAHARDVLSTTTVHGPRKRPAPPSAAVGIARPAVDPNRWN
jgi:hypothetical protein